MNLTQRAQRAQSLNLTRSPRRARSLDIIHQRKCQSNPATLRHFSLYPFNFKLLQPFQPFNPMKRLVLLLPLLALAAAPACAEVPATRR